MVTLNFCFVLFLFFFFFSSSCVSLCFHYFYCFCLALLLQKKKQRKQDTDIERPPVTSIATIYVKAMLCCNNNNNKNNVEIIKKITQVSLSEWQRETKEILESKIKKVITNYNHRTNILNGHTKTQHSYTWLFVTHLYLYTHAYWHTVFHFLFTN